MCNGLAESSDGQMSLSPAKGEMETVWSLMAGMLSLKPPSTYLWKIKAFFLIQASTFDSKGYEH